MQVTYEGFTISLGFHNHVNHVQFQIWEKNSGHIQDLLLTLLCRSTKVMLFYQKVEIKSLCKALNHQSNWQFELFLKSQKHVFAKVRKHFRETNVDDSLDHIVDRIVVRLESYKIISKLRIISLISVD